MKPLSLNVRRVYAALFFILFVAVLFVASVYASGYRLIGLSFEQTGGIHVSVPISGADVTVDGKLVGTSGFLSRSFFIDNLKGKNYTVAAVAPEFYPWEKTVIVEPSIVSDISAFMVPKNLGLVAVVATSSPDSATTTRAVSPAEYALLLSLFEEKAAATTTATSTAALAPNHLSDSAVEVILRDGNVFVRWKRELGRAPHSFCVTPRACAVEVTVENTEANATRAELFRDGVVYGTTNAGVFFAEVDIKPPQLVVPLYDSPGAEFRIYQGEIVIKNDANLFVISGFGR